jgi:hypothetical protein
MFYKRLFKKLKNYFKLDFKQCFSCKKELSLNKFPHDFRKYQRESDKGKCKVCINCEEDKALINLTVIRFNTDINKFHIISFNSKKEVQKHFRHERRKVKQDYRLYKK